MAFRLVDDGNLKQNYVEISILCDLAPTIMCSAGKPDFLYIQVFSRSRLLIAGKSTAVVVVNFTHAIFLQVEGMADSLALYVTKWSAVANKC